MTAEKAIADRVAKQLGLKVRGQTGCYILDTGRLPDKLMGDNSPTVKLWDALLAAETRLEAERWRSVEKDGLPEPARDLLGTNGRAMFRCYFHDNCGEHPWCKPGSVDPIELLEGERVTHYRYIVPPSEESK